MTHTNPFSYIGTHLKPTGDDGDPRWFQSKHNFGVCNSCGEHSEIGRWKLWVSYTHENLCQHCGEAYIADYNERGAAFPRFIPLDLPCPGRRPINEIHCGFYRHAQGMPGGRVICMGEVRYRASWNLDGGQTVKGCCEQCAKQAKLQNYTLTAPV